MCRLLTMQDCNGKHHECRLALGAFLADLQEQWDALGLKYFRDVSTLATKEDVGDPDSLPAAQKEADMSVSGSITNTKYVYWRQCVSFFLS